MSVDDGTLVDSSDVISLTINPAEEFLSYLGEFQVNSLTNESQQTFDDFGFFFDASPLDAIAANASGDVVISWQSINQDGSGWGVYAQRYDVGGNPVGPEVLVNTTTSGSQVQPSVAISDSGAWLVVWRDLSLNGVYGQLFAASGSQIGSEFSVSGTGGRRPSVAMDASGNAVVVWEAIDANGLGVFGQLMNSDGTLSGTAFSVNENTTGQQDNASVAMSSSGGFVMVWESQGQDSSGEGVFARRFASGGTPISGEFQVNTTTFAQQRMPSVGIDDSNGFVIVWEGSDSNGAGVFGQRFANDGALVGGEFQVNTTTTAQQWHPAVDTGSNGNFVVAWEGTDSNAGGIFAQLYDSSGNAMGTEFEVNSTMSGLQSQPMVAIDDGEFGPVGDPRGVVTVAWSSLNQDGSGFGVFAQRFAAVNDEPTFSIGSNQTHNEDGGAISLSGFVTSISPGPPNESGQTVMLSIGLVSNPVLFSVAPAVDASGNVTYTLAGNANGSSTIEIRATDNGSSTPPNDNVGSRTFTVTVNPVNDEPTFILGANPTHNEDSGAISLTSFVTGVTPGPPNESGQTVTLSIGLVSNPVLFSVAPAVDASGNVTYTLASNANGSSTIEILATDNGSSTPPNDNVGSRIFTVTVNPVNDEPTFTIGSNQTHNEDGGTIVLTSFVTGVSPGPANESGQTVTLSIGLVGNSSLFALGPAVDASGNVTYTLAGNANGSSTVQILATDNGSNTPPNDNVASRTLTVTVNPVNDEPTFSIGSNQTHNEDGGAISLSGFVTSISPGPPNESGQTVMLSIGLVSNPVLFSVAPAVDASGNVTYTLAGNANGSSTIEIRATDNGSSTPPNDNVGSRTFTVTVNPVNDEPTLIVPGPQSLNEASNLPLPGITVDDVDGGTLVITIVATGGTLVLSGTTNLLVTGNGTLSVSLQGSIADLNVSLATLLYSASADFNGIDMLQASVNDGALSSPTESIEVTVNNVPPTITLSGNPTSLEGDAYELTLGAVTDPGNDTVTLYTVTWGDGIVESFMSPGLKSHGYADGPANRTIRVDLVDEDGTHLNAGSWFVEVDNVAPSIDSFSVPSIADEGDTVTVTASASDPAGVNDLFSYAWTVDKDGLPYASGSGSEFDFVPNDDGEYLVSLTVSDEDGGSSLPMDQLVTVDNVSPMIVVDDLSGQIIEMGTFASFSSTGALFDPGIDTFTLEVDFGDGTVADSEDATNQVVLNADGTFALSHDYLFAQPMAFALEFTARDDDGGETIRIGDALIVIGSLGPDEITVKFGSIHVFITDDEGNEVSIGTFEEAASIFVLGGADDDQIVVEDAIVTPVSLFGGDGNDMLQGGGGNDLLEGGDGDNTLAGGQGNDRVVGGVGANVLSGGGGNDILEDGGGQNTIIGGSGSNTFIQGDGVNAFAAEPGSTIPEVYAERYETIEGTPLVVTTEVGVLQNDVNPTAAPLGAVNLVDAQNGDVILNVDGSFTYVPNDGFSGIDSFLYQASGEGGESSQATVTITVVSQSLVFGDYNYDKIVDLADYVVWRHLSGSRHELQADGDRNGVVDAGDFGVWRTNFGEVLSQLSAQGEILGLAANREDDFIAEPPVATGSHGTKVDFISPGNRNSFPDLFDVSATSPPGSRAIRLASRNVDQVFGDGNYLHDRKAIFTGDWFLIERTPQSEYLTNATALESFLDADRASKHESDDMVVSWCGSTHRRHSCLADPLNERRL